jgi:hypothetical protein
MVNADLPTPLGGGQRHLGKNLERHGQGALLTSSADDYELVFPQKLGLQWPPQRRTVREDLGIGGSTHTRDIGSNTTEFLVK